MAEKVPVFPTEVTSASHPMQINVRGAVVVDDLDPRQLRVLGDLHGPSLSSSSSSSLSSLSSPAGTADSGRWPAG